MITRIPLSPAPRTRIPLTYAALPPVPDAAARARYADLVVLPTDIPGTSCASCQYLRPAGCTHPAVLQPVQPHWCCILPGTLVDGDFVAGSKSLYTGEAVEIRTRSGRSVSVTVNHPILSENGLVAAGTLQEGGYLLSDTRGVCGVAGVVQPHDEHDAPSRIEEVFETLRNESPSVFIRSIEVSSVDFHGDGEFIQGQVEIVGSNRLLGGYGDSQGLDSGRHLEFIPADFDPGTFPRNCHLSAFRGGEGPSRPRECVDGVFAAGEPLVAIEPGPHFGDNTPYLGRQGGPGLVGHFGFGEATGLAGRAAFDPSAFEDLRNLPFCTAEQLCDFGHAVLGVGSIQADYVVSVRRFHYSGPVYDLQSTSGLLLAGGIVVSNCAFWDRPGTVRVADLMPGAVPYAKDAAGHEHKPSGPGGGQFTGSGGGSGHKRLAAETGAAARAVDPAKLAGRDLRGVLGDLGTVDAAAEKLLRVWANSGRRGGDWDENAERDAAAALEHMQTVRPAVEAAAATAISNAAAPLPPGTVTASGPIAGALLISPDDFPPAMRGAVAELVAKSDRFDAPLAGGVALVAKTGPAAQIWRQLKSSGAVSSASVKDEPERLWAAVTGPELTVPGRSLRYKQITPEFLVVHNPNAAADYRIVPAASLGAAPEPVSYAAAHAPAGGVTVGGKRFTGGQFIPAEVMAHASPEERQAVESGESRGKPLPPAGGAKLAEPPKSKEWKPTMPPAAAKAWAADSAWKDPLYHVTQKHNVEAIRQGGFRVAPGAFGTGVYFSLDGNPKAATGSAAVDAAPIKARVDVKNPLNLDFTSPTGDWEKDPNFQIWESLKGGDGEAGRQRLLEAGYDAVSIKFGTTEYRLVLDPQSIVIEDDAKSAETETTPSAETPREPNPIEQITAALPETARARLQTRVTEFRPHGTVAAVTDAWYAGEPNPPPANKRTPCLGFYDPETGVLNYSADGVVDARGVLAHELAHALDQSDDRKFFDLSGHPEFLAAWRAELKGGALSRYAGYDEVEGFAEIGRALWGTDGGAAVVAERFPLCYAYFKKVGLA